MGSSVYNLRGFELMRESTIGGSYTNALGRTISIDPYETDGSVNVIVKDNEA